MNPFPITFPTFKINDVQVKVALVRIASDATYDIRLFDAIKRSPQHVSWENQSGCRCIFKYCGTYTAEVKLLQTSDRNVIVYYVFSAFRYGGDLPDRIEAPSLPVHAELIKFAAERLAALHKIKFTDTVEDALRKTNK